MKVTIENLTLCYEGNTVVRDLDLEVADGESLVLLGQSGCGKTSTMRCVAGLETPNAGRIAIGDRVVHDSATGRSVPPHKRNVGMVFQSYAVWPHRTVFENVAFSLRMQKVAKGELRQACPGRPGTGRVARVRNSRRKPAQRRPDAARRAWRAAWSCAPACCCSTNRCPTLTPGYANDCAWNCGSCNCGSG